MYLCKHRRDHVLEYLVMEKRKRGRKGQREKESSIQVDNFNSTLREITSFSFIVIFFEQIFNLGNDVNLKRPYEEIINIVS